MARLQGDRPGYNHDWTWQVPVELAVLVKIIADRYGFAWEQIACMTMANGLADTIGHLPDARLVEQLAQAIEELKQGPLRDFRIEHQTYKVVDSETVHYPGMSLN